MTAGYSGTPLPKKLGIKPHHSVLLLGAPTDFRETLGALPEGVALRDAPDGAQHDVILCFVDAHSELMGLLPSLRSWMHDKTGLWCCWPKKASKRPTDLSDGVIRRTVLDTGLVDNKVCAVDQTWSGLRFVVRVKDRT